MLLNMTAPDLALALPSPGDRWTWPNALVAAVAYERRLRRELHAMSQLDDHPLRDIGLDRAQIATAVRHGRP